MHHSVETPGDGVVTGGGVATLITGDRVSVTTSSDGRTSAVILSGSPHAALPMSAVQFGDDSYVIPRLPVGEQAKLDSSLFNVSALAMLAGDSVPVEVTFRPGVRPHAIPGLDLDPTQPEQKADGSIVVPAHYDTATSGVVAGSAWQGVTSVRLPAGGPSALATGRPMHELTVHVVDRQGQPVRFEQAWVINVDDAAVFKSPIPINDGVGTVSVPQGDYAVFAGNFRSVVSRPDFAVRADTTVELSLADATVHPAEAVLGHSPTDTAVSLARAADRHGGYNAAYLGSRFTVRVQPVVSTLPHGTMWSSVGGTFAPSDELDGGLSQSQVYASLAYTKDFRHGVPEDMSFTHSRADFAIVPQRFFANGPAATHSSEVVGYAPFEQLGIAQTYPVHTPGQRTVWLQGSPSITWDQGFSPIESVGEEIRIASLTRSGRYTPGLTHPVTFSHGPVGPGLEAAYDAARTGPSCGLCRTGDRLHGVMPLFSGAGTAMSGQLSNPGMGSWRLSRDGSRLASGHFLITPDVLLLDARDAYLLRATSRPGVAEWRMSTTVRDVWGFTSGSGDAAIPLLMPSYVPRVTMSGTLRAGPVRWPLDFGNLGPVDATVSKATVSLSTDGGARWRPATVTRLDRNSFAVTYTNPAASGSARYMSLRVTGVDSAGRTVTETAMRAYRLVAAPVRPTEG